MAHLPSKEYLTVSEVALAFGVSPLTVRNWDRAGKLVATRNPLNNYRVYRRTDIETLLGAIEFSGGKRVRLPDGSKKIRTLSVRSEGETAPEQA